MSSLVSRVFEFSPVSRKVFRSLGLLARVFLAGLLIVKHITISERNLVQRYNNRESLLNEFRGIIDANKNGVELGELNSAYGFFKMKYDPFYSAPSRDFTNEQLNSYIAAHRN